MDSFHRKHSSSWGWVDVRAPVQVECPSGPLCLLPENVHHELAVLTWELEVGHPLGSLVALDDGGVDREPTFYATGMTSPARETGP